MVNKSAIKSQIGGFNDGIPYGGSKDRAYNRYGSMDLLLQQELLIQNNQAIQIAIDFFSDIGTWEYTGVERAGDFSVSNLGDNSNSRTLSKAIRFESETNSTTHILKYYAGDNQSNGFYPNIFYFGNHNLKELDNIKVEVYAEESFTIKLYELNIAGTLKDTFHINFMPYQKAGYYKFTFQLNESSTLSIGRLIMAGSLPTTIENNIQNGYTLGRKHYKEEMTTEYKTRITNTLFYCKKIDFTIKVYLNTDIRLNSRLQELIREGNGNRPFLFIPYPKNPNKDSIYGILNDPAGADNSINDSVNYSFNVEEIN